MKYTVKVIENIVRWVDVEVNASDEDEAKERAFEWAYDLDIDSWYHDTKSSDTDIIYIED